MNHSALLHKHNLCLFSVLLTNARPWPSFCSSLLHRLLFVDVFLRLLKYLPIPLVAFAFMHPCQQITFHILGIWPTPIFPG